ncbi:zinc-dependent metalloprotease [Streptomyces carpaticus]|uniref:Zinc-dependent metalloprotease n=1 Tax=Streptomyces carpaticus TaxID=285558 RepID=A0ABV4ZN72_9ACTN
MTAPIPPPAASLARLRARAAADGLLYLSDEDANGPGAAHADAVPWAVPLADPFAALEEVLEVRRTALAGFARGVLPPDHHNGALEDRALLLHLYHRHQLTAVARLVGGVRYACTRPGTTPVAAAWSPANSSGPPC